MNVVVIGNGVAGVTCAMEVRKRDARAKIVVIGGETDYFFSRTALMYAYMDRMTRRDLEPFERGVYRKQRIDLVRGWVTDLDAERREVVVDGAKCMPYDRLVFAVGAKPNRFDWEGLSDAKDGVVHFVSMQDLDACERLTPTTERAVVVGGGLIGVELVECLVHHGVHVTFLIREPWYWPMALGREEADIVTAHLRAHGVDVRLGEQMTRVEADESGRVKAVRTDRGETLPCRMLGITTGVRPAIDSLRAFTRSPELSRGIVTNEYLETSLPGVFACGDCAEIRRPGKPPLVELIWYSAKRQGALAARNLFGDRVAYEPPIFFNSSKFFEIEYTTVGDVMKLPDDTPSILLTHPTRPVSARIVHRDGAVVGFNLLGSRWDHELFQRWIAEHRDPEWALARLAEAQFDVEFGRAPLAAMTRRSVPVVQPA